MGVHQKKITFFTPSLKKTGSEVVLFNLLSSNALTLKQAVVARTKGALLNQLPTNIHTDYIYRNEGTNYFYRLQNWIIKKLFLKRQLASYKNSIWYINTVVLPEIIDFAVENDIRVILHVHELEQMFVSLKPTTVQQLLSYPDLIIANSETTKAVLIQLGCVKAINLVYPCINPKLFEKKKDVYLSMRNQLQISTNQFVWAMCGTIDENKNPLLFIDIAKEVVQRLPATKFIWIGSAMQENLFALCKEKTRELNLEQSIHWQTTDLERYIDYFNCADGFVLTSERESFSLVTIEALLLGLPVVANPCGGVSELLAGTTSKIAEKKNAAVCMALHIVNFMNKSYSNDAETGKKRAAEFDTAIIAKQWAPLVESIALTDIE